MESSTSRSAAIMCALAVSSVLLLLHAPLPSAAAVATRPLNDNSNKPTQFSLPNAWSADVILKVSNKTERPNRYFFVSCRTSPRSPPCLCSGIRKCDVLHREDERELHSRLQYAECDVLRAIAGIQASLLHSRGSPGHVSGLLAIHPPISLRDICLVCAILVYQSIDPTTEDDNTNHSTGECVSRINARSFGHVFLPKL